MVLAKNDIVSHLIGPCHLVRNNIKIANDSMKHITLSINMVSSNILLIIE